MERWEVIRAVEQENKGILPPMHFFASPLGGTQGNHTLGEWGSLAQYELGHLVGVQLETVNEALGKEGFEDPSFRLMKIFKDFVGHEHCINVPFWPGFCLSLILQESKGDHWKDLGPAEVKKVASKIPTYSPSFQTFRVISALGGLGSGSWKDVVKC